MRTAGRLPRGVSVSGQNPLRRDTRGAAVPPRGGAGGCGSRVTGAEPGALVWQEVHSPGHEASAALPPDPGTFARGTLSRPGPFLSGSVARVLVWSYPVTERALPGKRPGTAWLGCASAPSGGAGWSRGSRSEVGPQRPRGSRRRSESVSLTLCLEGQQVQNPGEASQGALVWAPVRHGLYPRAGWPRGCELVWARHGVRAGLVWQPWSGVTHCPLLGGVRVASQQSFLEQPEPVQSRFSA